VTAKLRKAIEGEPLPLVVVDVDAFDRNLGRMMTLLHPSSTWLRLASKSVRVPALLQRALAHGAPLTRGLMCFTVDEAETLAELGFDDLFVAYPTLQSRHLETLARLTRDGKNVSLAVDSQDGIDAMDRAGRSEGVRLKGVICTDMALSPLGGRVFLGVRRSPLRTAEQVLAFAREMKRRQGVVVHGLLAYEAQVAGMGDDNRLEPAQNPLKRWIRSASARDAAARRGEMVEALRDEVELVFVNGGGTGSLDTTPLDEAITEVTAGSGLYVPHLFDHFASAYMKSLEPSCFFALEAVRRPSPKHVTCAGGGYVASGAAAKDKLPLPWWPAGLSLLPMEGAGEVQTPLLVPHGVDIQLGDAVLFRHAKAGEIMERTNEVVLVSGDKIVERVPTYRGLGKSFL
jgi:D-serine deaminase-like pyridoxal phosphate-dependent protein